MIPLKASWALSVTTTLLVSSACSSPAAFEVSPEARRTSPDWVVTDGGVPVSDSRTDRNTAPPTGETTGAQARVGDAGATTSSPLVPDDPPEPRHDDPAVQAAIDVWRARADTEGDVGSPDTEACEALFASLEVITPSSREFRRLCQRCDTEDDEEVCEGWGRIYACAAHTHDGALIVVDARLARSDSTRDSLVVHEALHHLGTCSGEGSDPGHNNEEWWCGDVHECLEGSAIRRARGRGRYEDEDEDEDED